LNKNAKRILVAGTHADDLGYQCGGWTKTWYGMSGRITVGKTFFCAAFCFLLILKNRFVKHIFLFSIVFFVKHCC